MAQERMATVGGGRMGMRSMLCSVKAIGVAVAVLVSVLPVHAARAAGNEKELPRRFQGYLADPTTPALIIAILNGDGPKIRELAVPEKVATPARTGETPLMFAAALGQRDSIELLVAKGAGIDAVEKKGQTALIIAALNRQLVSVQTLVEKGAAVGAIDKAGYDALIAAAGVGAVDVVAYLLKHGAVHDAKADPRNVNGTTALMMAVKTNHPDTVRTILDAGVDVNRRSAKGFTALDYALGSKDTSIAELLRSRGGKASKELSHESR